jgi:hypothetical protein
VGRPDDEAALDQEIASLGRTHGQLEWDRVQATARADSLDNWFNATGRLRGTLEAHRRDLERAVPRLTTRLERLETLAAAAESEADAVWASYVGAGAPAPPAGAPGEVFAMFEDPVPEVGSVLARWELVLGTLREIELGSTADAEGLVQGPPAIALEPATPVADKRAELDRLRARLREEEAATAAALRRRRVAESRLDTMRALNERVQQNVVPQLRSQLGLIDNLYRRMEGQLRRLWVTQARRVASVEALRLVKARVSPGTRREVREIVTAAREEYERLRPFFAELRRIQDYAVVMQREVDEGGRFDRFFRDLRSALASGFEPAQVDALVSQIERDNLTLANRLADLGLPRPVSRWLDTFRNPPPSLREK